MDYRILLLALEFLTLPISSQTKPPFTIEINNFTCRILDPTMGHELTCLLHRKRIVPLLSARFSLKKTVNAFNLFFDLSIMKKDNNKMSLGRHKLDGCNFLNSFYGHNIFGKFFKRIQKSSNIPKKCPVIADKLFEIRNYSVLAAEYPQFMPALTHQLMLQVETDNKIIADIYIAGTVSC